MQLTPCVHVVDTLPQARAACVELGKHRVLAFDMEGQRLGRDGCISLVQLASSVDAVYIFDVLALGPLLFSPSERLLAPLLQDEHIVKLCYDCRCDADALFSLHGVRPGGLYDLQIAYTLLFQQCGDPFLKGLHKALQAPGILPLTSLSEEVIRRKVHTKRQGNVGERMMSRPLSTTTLAYCASDVIHLFAMHALWSSRLAVDETALMEMSRLRMCRFLDRTDAPPWCMSRLDFSLS